MTDTKTRPPRFNHVALSLPPDALDAAGRAEIVDYYHDTFGWTEYPQLTQDRKLLVLGVHTYDQFVYLMGADPPLVAPRTDHVGLSVNTEGEFDQLVQRVKQGAARDERIDFDDHSVEDHEVVKIHSFYVRHLLPLTVEVQWWEWPAG